MPLNRLVNHKLNNLIQTLILIGALLGLLCLLGWSIAGKNGIIWAAIISIFPLFASLHYFPSLTLKMYGARPLQPCEAPKLHAILQELASRARLPVAPRLHYIGSNAPLVFSTGHGPTAAIAVSYAILRLLTLRELAAVMAHEISHIYNKDTWVMSFADVVSRVTHTMSLLGQILVLVNLPLIMMGGYFLPWFPLLLMLAAPIMSALLQLALSRIREYNADIHSIRLSGDPNGLSSALAKMEEYQRKIFNRTLATQKKAEPSLLRTHPPTAERIRRLQSLRAELAIMQKGANLSGYAHEDVSAELGKAPGRPRRRFTGLWH